MGLWAVLIVQHLTDGGAGSAAFTPGTPLRSGPDKVGTDAGCRGNQRGQARDGCFLRAVCIGRSPILLRPQLQLQAIEGES